MSKVIIYTDGGSRGNPGHAAIGVIADLHGLTHAVGGAGADQRGKKSGAGNIKEYSQYIGITTNNEAEYQAVIFGLKKIKHLIGKEKAKKTGVEVLMDSELVANQLNGEYKIKEKTLVPFFIEIWNLKQDFKKVEFIFIPREQNKRADAMVNKELDSQSSKLF